MPIDIRSTARKPRQRQDPQRRGLEVGGPGDAAVGADQLAMLQQPAVSRSSTWSRARPAPGNPLAHIFGYARMESETGNNDSEVQRTMPELLHQFDGLEASNKIKIFEAASEAWPHRQED